MAKHLTLNGQSRFKDKLTPFSWSQLFDYI